MPGIALVLATHAGPVRFQPLFLSRRGLRDVVDGARGLRIRAARMRRSQSRRQFQQDVTLAAAALAGSAATQKLTFFSSRNNQLLQVSRVFMTS